MEKATYHIEFHPAAVREIREAIEWYRVRNEEAAAEFRALIQSAEKLVQQLPESWAPYQLETRGFRFQKFPFVLVYIVRDERIVVIALAHTKRKPGYWRERIL